MQLRKTQAWIAEIRAPFLTASIIPILLGTAVAWATSTVILWDVFVLTLIAGVCVHAGANVANDYFDHLSGTDEINVEFVRPFSGGSRMIQLGYLSPKEVLGGSILFFIIGGSIGLYLTFTRSIIVLLLGIIGVFSGFFYTAPPFKLSSRGIGELFVGINFGVLMTLGGYFVQTLEGTWIPIIASIPVALLITAVLYINEFPDAKADAESGKRTLVVRLGKERAAKGYTVLILSVPIYIIIAIITNFMSLYQLIALFTLPLSYIGVRQALRFSDDSFQLIPSYASTVLNHMLTGILLVLSYILQSFSVDYILTLIAAFPIVLIVIVQSSKLSQPLPLPPD